MKSEFGHLTYCTNIHPGESWIEHFTELKRNFPSIKSKVSPNKPMGIGLRLSNQASIDLEKPENLKDFKSWLNNMGGYVFTMNGFPYGDFHSKRVKEAVHAPDWTHEQRVRYTIRMFNILEKLVPNTMDGGISTSPLGYRHDFSEGDKTKAIERATENIVKVLEHLIFIKETQNKSLHLDIEPEPDGLLETGDEFLAWYENQLIPMAKEVLLKKKDLSETVVERQVKEHIQLCYDVCHFALGYEEHEKTLNRLKEKGIQIGKIQISAALKAYLNTDKRQRNRLATLFKDFDEDIYLHQVIARKGDSRLIRYKDLPEALDNIHDNDIREWRAHFHVPIFLDKYGELSSTQSEIINVLIKHKEKTLCQHLEVETYTWSVLPKKFQIPIAESIERELLWVKELLSI